MERAELSTYDLSLRIRPSIPVDQRIVIVDETERDLKRHGFPLSDDKLAELLEIILASKPRVIGIDKFRDFSIPPNSGHLARLQQTARDLVWIYQFGDIGVRAVTPPSGISREKTGFIDMVTDPNGVIRRGLLFLHEGSEAHSSFALRIALHYLAPDNIFATADPVRPSVMKLGAGSLPPFENSDGGYRAADARGYQFLLDYAQFPAPFASVSMTDVLGRNFDSDFFRDKIVIIGSSAESLKDYFHTPHSRVRSAGEWTTGAAIHAAMVSQLLRLAYGANAVVRTVPDWLEYLLLALACIAGATAWWAHKAHRFCAIVLVGLGLLVAAWYFSARLLWWFPIIPLASGFLIAVTISVAARAIAEAALRASVMEIFGKHVSPEVATELWRRRKELLEGSRLRPQTIVATVLFADIRGYSTVAERLEPTETVAWLNEILTVMTASVISHQGIVRQYVGDEIMAIFGFPVPSESEQERDRDARNAIHAALAMRDQLAEVTVANVSKGLPPIGVRIGIHTGRMISCCVGSTNRLEFAVVGDSVNLAARLQGLPQLDHRTLPPGESRILISAETHSRLDSLADTCMKLGEFDTKGRQAKVTIYQVAECLTESSSDTHAST